MAHLGPISMRPKRGQGRSPSAPNHKWAHLSQFLGPNWPKKALGPIWTTDHYGPHFQPWPLVNPRGHQQLKSTLSLNSRGRFSHSSMHPVLKDARVMHIWYYIPLCTIFSQKSNGEIFRTHFHDSKSRSPKPITNFKGGLFSSSVWKSMAAIRRSFQDPNHLALQELGWKFFQDHSRGILGGYSSFNQLSRQQVIQYSLDNSIDPYR
ncbi:hypothetical protein O181_025860 [Austropuccinia psidii MF-1]|uniref:Uncharacterized protein n=1 Tax=Austropuccinia psidii MF-1 TaxID=1389203 RepID=A0A9Q3H1L9_9BASI|nr:hypothetical protein [Austropuccinia psidii MF-1]